MTCQQFRALLLTRVFYLIKAFRLLIWRKKNQVLAGLTTQFLIDLVFDYLILS